MLRKKIRASMKIDCELTEPVDMQKYRVIYGDTDLAGVVYYGNYMRFLEFGRTEYMRNIMNMPYSLFEEEGIRFPVAEAYTRYSAFALYDNVLLIRSCIHTFTRKTIKFNYEIIREEDNKKIISASTLHMAVDINGKATSFPEKLLNVMKVKLNK